MMEALDYYVTTLINAFKNIAPYAIFLVGGYLIFIKMPFLFFRRSIDQQKKEQVEKPERIEQVQEKVKEKKAEQSHGQRHQHQQKKKAEPIRPKAPAAQSPEQILGFRSGEKITKLELKKRYFELLKQNHPDRVASMGEDFKKLADKNTKEINQAYNKLKDKAA